ncbi:MAG: GIY-YIG nuclease family protein [Proteobacteria bacterium]|nr:GIY-YIG nuclease family protein [Pseudomonadota bacterium]
MPVFVYILRCADDRYYVGTTRDGLERRIAEHNAGAFDGYTKWRRPVQLVYHEEFQNPVDAVAMERRLKGWSRAKKEALIRGDFERLKMLARNRAEHPHPSTGSG